MVLVHDTSSEWLLQMYEVSLKNMLNQIIEQTRNNIANDQREITPDISKAEVWLVHDALSHCAVEVYEVSTISLNSVQLTE